MVDDAISRLRTLGLYENNGNEDVPLTIEDMVENIVKEVHTMDTVPKTPAYNTGKLNQDLQRKAVQWDIFCQFKVKEMKKKPCPSFLLDNNGILRKVVKLMDTVEATIVVPRKLTSLIIVEFHNAKGHQGISCTVSMMRHYF